MRIAYSIVLLTYQNKPLETNAYTVVENRANIKTTKKHLIHVESIVKPKCMDALFAQ